MLTPSCKDFLVVPQYDILPGDIMFDSESNVTAGLVGLYDTFYPNRQDSEGTFDGNSWGFIPQMLLANHPTMDTQTTGWDIRFSTQEWTAGDKEFYFIWFGSYRNIGRANIFLSGLQGMDASMFSGGQTAKDLMEAQARAIRAYNYLTLVKNFGRVPMLLTGETYSTSPSKPRPESDEDTWNQIIEDLEFAAGKLDWTPINNEYGRITKGMAVGYLAESYMWLGDYPTAKGLYKQIIDSGVYELLPCYTTNFDNETGWTKEDIFSVVLWSDFGSNMNSWGPNADNYMWAARNSANMEHGGWGSSMLSWEWYESFEDGDRRRAASVVALGQSNPWVNNTARVNANQEVMHYPVGVTLGASDDKFIIDKPEGQKIMRSDYNADNWKTDGPVEGFEWSHVKQGGWVAPQISSTKFWRMHVEPANFQPLAFRYLRYSHVLLSYAECCFMTNDDTNGWAAIREIRNRAWGNLEAGSGLDPETYIVGVGEPGIVNAQVAKVRFNDAGEQDNNGTEESIKMDRQVTFPLRLQTETVAVPDAQEYYTNLKSSKGYSASVGILAVTTERRHEFSHEFNLYYDMKRVGIIDEHIDIEYPINTGTPNNAPNNAAYDDKRTYRTFVNNPNMLKYYPIPANEILLNDDITQADQNPGY